MNTESLRLSQLGANHQIDQKKTLAQQNGSAMIEHVSLTVKDIESMTKFLCTAFPDFRKRGSGVIVDADRSQAWSHVGNDKQYIALYEARPGATHRPAAHTFTPSANHIGVVVDDVAAVKQRLIAAGYREGFVPEEHPYRRRAYIIDPEGFEWELVQYLSGDDGERNQY